MKFTIFFVIFLVFLNSCNVLKDKHRTNSVLTKKATKETNSIKYEYEFTPNDSLVYNSEIFKIKDSIVSKIGKNIILQANYKNSHINKVKCISKGKIKLSKTVTNIKENSDEKKQINTKDVTTEIKQDKTIYILILLILIVVLLIVVLIKK